MTYKSLMVIVLALVAVASAQAQQKKLPANAKVFIDPIENSWDQDLRKAIQDKKVPLVLVDDKKDAEYEISGHSESHPASRAKKWIMGSWHSDEQASIAIADLKSGEIVFAYSVNKSDSAHGKRSTAEACAKHIRDEAIAQAPTTASTE